MTALIPLIEIAAIANDYLFHKLWRNATLTKRQTGQKTLITSQIAIYAKDGIILYPI